MHKLLPGCVSPAPKRKLDYCPPNTAAVRHRNQSDSPTLAADHLPDVIQPSSFRNVSSCNRCRLRKTRCDQRLPRCQACERAGARCVGYDAAKKKEIPRSYVFFLEARVDYLVGVLIGHRIRFKAGAAFDEFAVEPGPDSSPSHGPDYERALGNAVDDGQHERHGIATPEIHPEFDGRDGLDLEGLSEKVQKRGIRSKESLLHAATDSGSGHTIRESLSAPQAGKPDADCPGFLTA
ncbi:Transcription factor [Aspergillus sp. HF37]|nr:Transcription factor [Aspergillus sp. HF37]